MPTAVPWRIDYVEIGSVYVISWALIAVIKMRELSFPPAAMAITINAKILGCSYEPALRHTLLKGALEKLVILFVKR